MVSAHLFLCSIKRFLQTNSVTCQENEMLATALLFLRNWKEIFSSGIPPGTERCLCRPNVNRFLMQAFCSIFKQHISLEENQHFQIYKKKGYSVKSLFIFWRDSSTPLPYKGVSVSWLCSHSVFSSLSQFKMDSNTVASFVQKPQTIVRFISIVSASVAHNLIQGRKRSFIS